MADNIKVAVRIRPLLHKEKHKIIRWEKRDENSIYQIHGEGRNIYTFDNVFDKTVNNASIFESVVKPIVDSSVDGFNGTVFVYGQTSCGKTHTMMGSPVDMGVIPLSINHIFDQIKKTINRKFLIRVSYIEIYNERVQDLLNPDEKNIKVHEDNSGNVFVKAKEEVSDSPTQVLDIMKRGEKNRRIAATHMNTRSSRSHTLFRIVIESKTEVEGNGHYKVAWLNLVDLAGSERMSGSASETTVKEGAFINTSLSALGLVIKQLSEGAPYQNFRDSKLTRILQQSLGGNSKTLIIANITVVSEEETNSTLQFASRAKSVKNKPEINETVEERVLMKRYEKQLALLKDELCKRQEELKKTIFERDSAQGSTKQLSLKNRQLKERIHLMEKNLISDDKNVPVPARRHTFGPSNLTTVLEESCDSDEELLNIDLSKDDSILSITDRNDVLLAGMPLLEGFELDLIETEKLKIKHMSLHPLETSSSEDDCEEICAVAKKAENISDSTPIASKRVLRQRLEETELELKSLQEMTRLEKELQHHDTVDSLKEEMISYRKQYIAARDNFERLQKENTALTEKVHLLDSQEIINEKNREIHDLKEEIVKLMSTPQNGNDLIGEIKKGLTGLTKLLTPTESAVTRRGALDVEKKNQDILKEQAASIASLEDELISVLEEQEKDRQKLQLKDKTIANLRNIEVPKLKKDLLQSNEQNSQICSLLKQQGDAFAEISTENADFKSRLKDAYETIANFKTNNRSLELEKKNVECQLKSNACLISTLKDTEESLKEMVLKLETELEDVKRTLHSQNEEMEKYKGNEAYVHKSEYISMENSLKNQLHQYDAEFVQHENSMQELRKTIASLERQLEASKSKYISMETSLKNQLHQSDAKFVQQDNSMQELRKTIASLERQLEESSKSKETELTSLRLLHQNSLNDLKKLLEQGLIVRERIIKILETGLKELFKEQGVSDLQLNEIVTSLLHEDEDNLEVHRKQEDLKDTLKQFNETWSKNMINTKDKLRNQAEMLEAKEKQIMSLTSDNTKLCARNHEILHNIKMTELSVKQKTTMLETGIGLLQNELKTKDLKIKELEQQAEKIEDDFKTKLGDVQTKYLNEIYTLTDKLNEYDAKNRELQDMDTKSKLQKSKLPTDKYGKETVSLADIKESFKEKHRQALDNSRDVQDVEVLDPENLMDEIKMHEQTIREQNTRINELKTRCQEKTAELCVKTAELDVVRKELKFKNELVELHRQGSTQDEASANAEMKEEMALLKEEINQLTVEVEDFRKNQRCPVERQDKAIQHDPGTMEGSGSGIETFHNLMLAKTQIKSLLNENVVLKDKLAKLKKLCQLRGEQLKNI